MNTTQEHNAEMKTLAKKMAKRKPAIIDNTHLTDQDGNSLGFSFQELKELVEKKTLAAVASIMESRQEATDKALLVDLQVQATALTARLSL